jgi:hypothetical protein
MQFQAIRPEQRAEQSMRQKPNPCSKKVAHTTMNPSTEVGDTDPAGTREVANSTVVMYPLLTRFCRHSWVTSDGQLDTAMRHKRKED